MRLVSEQTQSPPCTAVAAHGARVQDACTPLFFPGFNLALRLVGAREPEIVAQQPEPADGDRQQNE